MKVRGRVAGLLLALVAHLWALGTAGGGHGWNTPLWASFLLWAALPATLGTISPFGPYPRGEKNILIGLLLIGLAADAGLWWATVGEGTGYFWVAMRDATLFPVFWLLIWASWQLIVLASLAKGQDDPGEVA